MLERTKSEVTREGPMGPKVSMKSGVFQSFPEKSQEVWSYDIEWEKSLGKGGNTHEAEWGL